MSETLYDVLSTAAVARIILIGAEHLVGELQPSFYSGHVFFRGWFQPLGNRFVEELLKRFCIPVLHWPALVEDSGISACEKHTRRAVVEAC